MNYTGSVPDTRRRSPDWRDAALCRPDPDAMFDTTEAGIETARRLCAGCPAKRPCLADAIRTGDVEYGIRGGLLPRERRAVVKELARREQAAKTPVAEAPRQKRKSPEPARCGTNSGHRKHVREKTPICEPCRQAHTKADSQLRRTGTTKAVAS